MKVENHSHAEQARFEPPSAPDAAKKSGTSYEANFQPHSPMLKPELPKPVELSAKVKKETIAHLATLFDKGQISLDNLIPQLLFTLIATSKERLACQEKLLEQELAWHEAQNDKRNKCATEELDQAKQAAFAGKIQNSTVAASLGLTSLASIVVSGFTPFGLIGAGLGALLALDALCDDAGKNYLAKWCAQGSEEQEATWKGRIHLFTNISSFALSFGLRGPVAVKVATNIAKAATGAYQAKQTLTLNEIKANLMEIDEICQQSEEMQDKLAFRLSELVKFNYYIFELLKQMSDKQNRTLQMLQRV
jgi:Fe-S cluster biosynthesis and repair protein YggX